MITPAEIQNKAGRLYPKAIEAWLRGDETFFPLAVSSNREYRGASVAERLDEKQRLEAGSKQAKGYGYSVRWERRKSRKIGENDFPAEIYFESLDDLARLIGKREEYKSLVRSVSLVREQLPTLDAWLVDGGWKRLVAAGSQVEGLVQVARYLVEHPRPNCFPRELPLAVSTKLVEQNRGLLSEWLDRLLPPHAIDFQWDHRDFARRYGFRTAAGHLMLRVLDPVLQAELGLPFDELSLPLESLSRLDVRSAEVFIVENRTNLLTLPELPRGLALGGLGNAVTPLLAIPWLAQQRVTYWGDLDLDGLAILSRLRARLPAVRSVMMDGQTLQRFRHLATEQADRQIADPEYLSESEMSAFTTCRDDRLRLEQEHLPQAYVNDVLRSATVPQQ